MTGTSTSQYKETDNFVIDFVTTTTVHIYTAGKKDLLFTRIILLYK